VEVIWHAKSASSTFPLEMGNDFTIKVIVEGNSVIVEVIVETGICWVAVMVAETVVT